MTTSRWRSLPNGDTDQGSQEANMSLVESFWSRRCRICLLSLTALLVVAASSCGDGDRSANPFAGASPLAPGRTPETDPCVILDGPAFEMCFQEVAAPTDGKRAVHLDISSPGRPQERDRLVSLGASIVEEFDRHTRMRDPEGNDFCITAV